jgi:hypothetical protein
LSLNLSPLPVPEGFSLPKWFVEDPAVQRWLRRYGNVATLRGFAFYMVMYVEWLKKAKGIAVSPVNWRRRIFST